MERVYGSRLVSRNIYNQIILSSLPARAKSLVDPSMDGRIPPMECITNRAKSGFSGLPLRTANPCGQERKDHLS